MTDSSSSPTPASLNSLLDLNLTTNLNPETVMPDDMHNVKYRQLDTFYGPILFKPLEQITVDHPMFKVISFVEFGPYLKSLSPIRRLEEQLSDIVANPSYKFMEQNWSMVPD